MVSYRIFSSLFTCHSDLLSCRTGSLPLSILFLFFSLLLLGPYLSIRLFIMLFRISFTCCSSFDNIFVCVNVIPTSFVFMFVLMFFSVQPYLSIHIFIVLVVSILFLFVFFSVPPYLSVRLFIVSYWIFTCCFDPFSCYSSSSY